MDTGSLQHRSFYGNADCAKQKKCHKNVAFYSLATRLGQKIDYVLNLRRQRVGLKFRRSRFQCVFEYLRSDRVFADGMRVGVT